MEDERASRVRPLALSSGTGYHVQYGTNKFLGPFTCEHVMRNINQILHGDQTILEEKILTGMLTRDLFAIANFLVSYPVRTHTHVHG